MTTKHPPRKAISGWRAIGCLAVVSALFAAACDTSASAPPVGSGQPTAAPSTARSDLSGRAATVILAKDMSVDLGMDPARAIEEISYLVLGNAYSRLVRFPTATDGTPDFSQVEGDLAASWTVSPDAKVFTFKLKPEAKFTSGNVLTAADVVWSYNRLKNVNGAGSAVAAGIASIAAPDAATVEITLAAPDLGFLKSLTGANFSVLDSALVKQNGGDDSANAETADTAETFLSTTTAGSGPFQMTDYQRNQTLTLKRVDPYWGGPTARIQQFIVQNIPDPNLQAAALERGDIDITWNLLGNSDLVTRLETQGFQVDDTPILEYYAMLFNADPKYGGPVANEKVQLALKYAIDYDGLTKICPIQTERMAGLAPEWVGGLSPSDPSAIKLDVAKAKQLLSEAGYASGFPVTLSGFKYPSCPAHEQIATKIASDWAAIGVTATLDFKEFSQAIGAIRAGTNQISFTGWIGDYPDAANFAQYSLPVSNFSKRAAFKDGAPDESYKVDRTLFPSYDQLLSLSQQMLAATDQATRDDLYKQVEQLAIKASAVYPTMVIGQASVVAKDLVGFRYNVLYKYYLYRFDRLGG